MERRDFLRKGGMAAFGFLAQRERLKFQYPFFIDPSYPSKEADRLWKKLSENCYTIDDKIIEREIRKHDDWIVDFVDNIGLVHRNSGGDLGRYNIGLRRIEIPFVHKSKEDLAELIRDVYYGDISQKNILSCLHIERPSRSIDWDGIPPNAVRLIEQWLSSEMGSMENEMKIFLDALDHELYHGLIDSEFGLMSSKHYSGPSIDDMRKNVARMSGSSAYGSMLETVQRQYSNSYYDFFKESFGGIDRFMTHDFSLEKKRFKRYDALVNNNRRILENQNNRMLHIIKNTSRIQVPVDSLDDTRTRDFFKAMGRKYFDNLKEKSLMPLMITDGSENYMFREMPYLFIVSRKASDGFFFAIMENGTLKKIHELGVPIEELAGFARYSFGQSIQRVFMNETYARLFDGLYSIKLDGMRAGTNDTKFILDEENRDFFSKFCYKGSPAFRKGLERQDVALKLKGRGISSDKAKAAVEYATSYSFDGKQYSWPENDFRLKGPIPVK